jgi:hypothetical protein
MKNKIIPIIVAALLGVGVGAKLGYGPMLRYKSEGVLNMALSTSEYKQIVEIANNANNARRYLASSPLYEQNPEKLEAMVQTIESGSWNTPLPIISKSDIKDLPDLMNQAGGQLEKRKEVDIDNEFDIETETERNKKKYSKAKPVYLGLQLMQSSRDPEQAVENTAWLGAYIKDVALREELRGYISDWMTDSKQFARRNQEQKLKYEFEIEQAKIRIKEQKIIIAKYPQSALLDAKQVVNVRKSNAKYLSPMSQLIASESEIIQLTEKVRKLSREVEQNTFAELILKDVGAAVSQNQNGSESLAKLEAIIANASKKIKTNAEHEKLASISNDISQLAARFLLKAQFITPPSLPTRPERPTPLMYMVLVGFVFSFLTAVFCWRDAIKALLKAAIDDAKT